MSGQATPRNIAKRFIRRHLAHCLTERSRILKHLRPTYAEELDALSQTYADIRGSELVELHAVVARQAGGPASFIASGGMAAVATVAAQLHEHACLEPGTPLTPLAAIARPPLTTNAAMLFTSSAKHPDAREVMRRLGRPGMRPAAVVTHRPSEGLPRMPETTIVTLPPLRVREGFLAVNSVISMSAALMQAYLGKRQLPQVLPTPERVDPLPQDINRLLVLYPPSLAAVAVDLETRLVEIGLAAVQLADYRNFAHGRHTGIERNRAVTTILTLSDGPSRALADATAAALPEYLSVARWHTDEAWPASVLGLLAQSMRACGALGDAREVNVARPKVPAFGRTLYRLPVRRRLPETLVGPVDRKLIGIGGLPGKRDVRRQYTRALNGWIGRLGERRFAAVVLDYDGTVCATNERFDPPTSAVAETLDRVLARGLRLGFASGRGPSMHRELRRIIDPAHWPRVDVGLYNGGVLCRLDDELGRLDQPTPLIKAAMDRVTSLPFAASLTLEPRCTQLTIQLADGTWMKGGLLAALIAEACAQPPSLAVKVLSSGHSVDLVPACTSKTTVIDRIRHREGPVDVLCIGDQGQIGGNDFELLAAEPWSLSVDRTSADPTRCWYLADGSCAGPNLLVRYLGALRGHGAKATLKAGALL
jgi:hypothetical protein